MKKKRYEISDILPDALNPEAWVEWVENRVENGNPYTPLGAKKAINKLVKYSHKIQQQAVDRAIEAGWTGVFPESEKEELGFIEKHTDRSWRDEFLEYDNVTPLEHSN